LANLNRRERSRDIGKSYDITEKYCDFVMILAEERYNRETQMLARHPNISRRRPIKILTAQPSDQP
jgi:hypothetical protein